MNVVIRAHSAAAVSPDVKDYANEKVARLARHYDAMHEIRVDFSTDRRRLAEAEQVVQLTVHVNGQILKASESATDQKAAIDLVVDKMDRQLIKHKGKLTARHKGPGLGHILAGDVPAPAPARHESSGNGVVRAKRFQLHPMSTDRAIEEMEELGHSFYVYLEEDSGAVSVVYRRGEGGFGVLEVVV